MVQENFVNNLPNSENSPSSPRKANISSVNQIRKNQKSNINTSNWPSSFSIIPNPNTGLFELKLNEIFNMPSAISIISPLGYVILELNNPSKYNCSFDLTNYTDGIYAIRLIYIDHIETKTLIKSSQ